MDPVSQAVVGATLAVSFCRKKAWVKPALIAGVVGGLLPDIDVLIRSDSDPLMSIQYHRHFTHALAFVPLGGLIAAMLCWPLLKKYIVFAWIYLFATLGYATHGILDSMTNYGTHLWWPFTERRESWSIISIVDPVFTLTLLFLCGLSYRRKMRRYALIAAAFACLYWSFGYIQRERATENMVALAASRGHVVERFEVKPSLGNLVVWRTQYQYKNTYYIDAVRVVPWAENKRYEGGKVQAFTLDKNISTESVLFKDFERFNFFSDGWLAALPGDPSLIGDMRFAMLPNVTAPLWGIRMDLANTQQHVQFINIRRSGTDSLSILWAMIRGDDPPLQDMLATN
jgi:inner membrane protein